MRHQKALILFLSTLALAPMVIQQGCHSKELGDSERTLAPRSATIIVPGFKGSTLNRSDNGEPVWITAREALFGQATLAWNGSQLDLADAMDLKTVGLLKAIRIIPGLLSIDVYGSLSAELHKRFRSETVVVEFAYDWRQDPMEAVSALGTLVARLHEQGIPSVNLVAHSFGGYITAYYLRYGVQDPEQAEETWDGAEQVANVVLMGTPFLGAIIKFRDMLTGETVGLNGSLLDAIAHSSFPASYFLLPAPTETTFLSPGGEPLPISLYDPGAWRDHAWGLFGQDGLSAQANGERLRFLSSYLDRSAAFSRLVNAPPGRLPSSPPRILQVVGHGRKTLVQAIMQPKGLLFESYEDGDGTVAARSADLPSAYRELAGTTNIETHAAHSALWTEDEVKERIAEVLATRED